MKADSRLAMASGWPAARRASWIAPIHYASYRGERYVVHEFIAALRQLRRPIVLIAVAILVLQTLVAGLATAHAAARLAAFGADAGILCHGNGDDGDPADPIRAGRA